MRSGSLSTRLSVDLYETGRLNELVRQFAQWHQVPEDTVFKVVLSVDELVTNIVVHGGLRQPKVHEIVLRLSTHDDELSAEIEDDGCAFNPLEEPTPNLNLPLQERCTGGWGIHLARCFMDEIHYSRVGRRNLLTLTKRVS